ncbi:MAG: bifunctional adenosylcobinamide kinase/adenosylcobinamide-phosphate guanylyltransferase, partial [Campylobacterota bacterium]|nr:bifunctional adenosylcobinamide kinase/adenosylcobinamide-phosphate guanylyltransferase [Campylobacterota bacterium]
PIYLTTTSLQNPQNRQNHNAQRADQFIMEEEPLFVSQYISNASRPVLVECITMWISNMIYHSYDEATILEEVDKILALDKDIVFVQNDIGSSPLSDNELLRNLVDINGEVSMKLGASCDEVYHCIAGISNKIKG